MKKTLTVVLVFILFKSYSQIPQVPTHMELGNMKLKITSGAQKILQDHVDELLKNDKYIQKVADKAHLYFPIISKIFYEEGVPDAFKYLCIQESGFSADAVSSSNAVGFWQFKDFTAREVGLFVENDADERKHIIYSTKGAAKYLKKNYFYLKNWVYTCQSYQMGLGGTQRSVDQSLFGVEKMTIDKNTYWYVMKFLAHVIAYEDILKRKPSIEIEELRPVLVNSGEKLSDIANNNFVSLEKLEQNNIWLNRSRLPSYRESYYVMIPGVSRLADNKNQNLETITIELEESDPEEISRITNRRVVNPSVRIILKINNKKAILSNSGDSPVTLALRGGITKDQLLKYNDMIPGEEIVSNMVYYLQPKNSRSKISRHVTKEGESLWEISQKYGVKKKSLIRKNRLKLGEEPKTGRILYLRKKMPKDAEIEYVKVKNTIKAIETQNDSLNSIQTDTLEENLIQGSENEVLTDSLNEKLGKDTIALPVEKIIETAAEEIPIKENLEKNTSDLKQDLKSENTSFVHTVSAGETLYSISKKYDVKVEELVEWNQLNNLSLSIGQEIKILKN
ncbi:MAG: LysM peptidoglycan-binding domain-containing protein [Cytophagales bacterium]